MTAGLKLWAQGKCLFVGKNDNYNSSKSSHTVSKNLAASAGVRFHINGGLSQMFAAFALSLTIV